MYQIVLSVSIKSCNLFMRTALGGKPDKITFSILSHMLKKYNYVRSFVHICLEFCFHAGKHISEQTQLDWSPFMTKKANNLVSHVKVS